ncbi:MAG: L,D-transpeptidase family protein [Betaproteobacteria bacterium]|nr:L,D-transpeptidase family protein [Betaproteobacteria bacterium]
MRLAKSLARCVLAFAFALTSGSVAASSATSTAHSPEEGLSKVLSAIEANRLDLALTQVETLLAKYPKFRLAHLIRGDLLAARARPLLAFGDVSKSVPHDQVEELRAEALARLKAMRERPPVQRVPRLILQLHSEQKYALLIDSGKSRLYVFANVAGRPTLIADYYVTLGKRGVEKIREGDQKTPLGVYHVTGNLPRQKLPDFYGSGAFPINYPNDWDRRLGRNGSGIWLHGTPSDTYSRPPRASDGCIVLSNPDLESVGRYVQIGLTPVIIAEEIEWTDAAAIEADRSSLAAAMESWRAAWESRDTDRYLQHYSSRFHSAEQDLATWATHKRKVNAAKTWVKVAVSRVAMVRYPGEQDFVVVTFDQEYQSSNLANTMRKRQYWIKDNGRWRILYEGSA